MTMSILLFDQIQYYKTDCNQNNSIMPSLFSKISFSLLLQVCNYFIMSIVSFVCDLITRTQETFILFLKIGSSEILIKCLLDLVYSKFITSDLGIFTIPKKYTSLHRNG